MKVILIGWLLVLLTACTPQSVVLLESDAYEQLLQDEEVFVLNVHTPYEGELEDTDAIIEDWGHLALHQDQLPEDKNTPIALYCRSGRMSESAGQQLLELGYTKVYDLKGGMIAWKESGREVIHKI
jgi:rhodanese-related sulfurtransferase